ncbi:HemK2/MTQ2 family protein methyltransferase [Ferroglobus placidus]|uniref:HemK2/MTQ2 family protein methyltransferase n=1 Tax=Ferroglobus placidus TaxID=54261 RepID=UPI000AE3E145|nr:HemK2/MTQ2 family protein methyltransferase [Ferroglobus placidus]
MPTVYEVAEDSELLLEAAMEEVKEEDVVIEIGAGSGFVSEKLKGKCKFLLATDINPHAAKMCKEKGLEVVIADLFRGIKGKFTLILFNPPYLELEEEEKVGDWLEKAIDGGRGGIEVSVEFLKQAKEKLKENGRIILISSSHNFERLKEEIEKLGYKFEVVKKRKLFFEELYALKIQI